jgi:hypothetical protein
LFAVVKFFFLVGGLLYSVAGFRTRARLRLREVIGSH